MHIEDLPPLRRAIMEWIYSVNATKFLTISMDRHMSPERAEEFLERWFERLHHQMYGLAPELSGEKYMDMHGSCEYGAGGDIHHHVVARVSAGESKAFDSAAVQVWKQVLPASRLHVVDINDGPDDMFRIARYMTKSCNHTEWWKPHAQPKNIH